jgi:hypothetical protein
MKEFLLCLLASVRNLLTSKKVITGAITAIATTIIDDKETALRVAGIGSAVVLGFAAQDVGKERTKIQEQADIERLKREPVLPEITP